MTRNTGIYSHLSNSHVGWNKRGGKGYKINKRGGWNKRGGGAKIIKSINMEVEINVEDRIFWKKLVQKCNKRGVEGGINLRNQ